MINLYSVFHKPFHKPPVKYVIPIQAGRASAENKLDMQGDDTGENISGLNTYFCELTAMYWIVKNAERNCDAWGLCHYRRYFMQPPLSFKKKSLYTFRPSPQKMDKMVDEKLLDKMEQFFTDHDAIVQQPKFVHKKKGVIRTLEENYMDKHIPAHWEVLRQVLFEKYPGYKESWASFVQSKKMSFYNMMIAKWEVWDAYAEWLFDILFEVYPQLHIDDDPYQKRVMAFMSERLMNLFLMHNKIKTAYLPIASFDK